MGDDTIEAYKPSVPLGV